MQRSLSLALIGAVAIGAALAYAARDRLRPGPPLLFVERAEPGFRDLVAPASEGAAPAAALAPLAPADPVGDAADLCAALFDDPDAPRIGNGPVIAVYFTDYRCPYCRVLSDLLAKRAAAGELTVIVREWPILGPASTAAARVALAAARQDAFAPAHERLMRSAFIPTPAYVEALAGELGVDAAALLADASGPEVAAQLAANAALAAQLGFQGTPGLVVGRTVARRSVREPMLDRLIREEAALGDLPCPGLTRS